MKFAFILLAITLLFLNGCADMTPEQRAAWGQAIRAASQDVDNSYTQYQINQLQTEQMEQNVNNYVNSQPDYSHWDK